MTYREFKNSIRDRLQASEPGLTWNELRDSLGLPYDRPCPEWTRRLEQEIGLVRRKGTARALVWSLRPGAGHV